MTAPDHIVRVCSEQFGWSPAAARAVLTSRRSIETRRLSWRIKLRAGIIRKGYGDAILQEILRYLKRMAA